MASKNPRFTSPRGTAVYPHLTTPDTKFKDEGEFHTKLRVPADKADALVKQIEAEIAKIVAETKKEKKLKTVKLATAPYSVDDESGEVTFTFKMKASGVSKKTGKDWSRTPVFFDAKGAAIKEAPKVGGGSTLRVNFEFFPYYTAAVGAGVKLALEAIQVLDLVEFGGNRKASDYGFETEDGFDTSETDATEAGFTADGEDEPAPAAGTESDDF
jgi:hypothetical protein